MALLCAWQGPHSGACCAVFTAPPINRMCSVQKFVGQGACTALGGAALQLEMETAALLNQSFSASHREGKAEGPATGVGCWAGSCVQAGSFVQGTCRDAARGLSGRWVPGAVLQHRPSEKGATGCEKGQRGLVPVTLVVLMVGFCSLVFPALGLFLLPHAG